MFESILRAALPFSASAQPVCCPMPSAGISTTSSALRFRHCMSLGEASLPRRGIRQKPLSYLQVSLIASLRDQLPPNPGGTCIETKNRVSGDQAGLPQESGNRGNCSRLYICLPSQSKSWNFQAARLHTYRCAESIHRTACRFRRGLTLDE